MKRIVIFAFVLFFAVSVCSCNKENGQGPVDIHGKYLVLNNGSWNKSNASVSLYDPETGKTESDVFFRVNGNRLGDTAQDIFFHNGSYYIAMTGSCCIWKTDGGLKVTERMEYEVNGATLGPRCLAALDGEVYASFQEGYVKNLVSGDDASAVGELAMPEGLAVSGNTIYVAESDGYGDECAKSRLGIITKVGSSLDYSHFDGLNRNLQVLALFADRLFALSWNVYDRDSKVVFPAKIQSYNLKTGKVVDYAIENPVAMAADGEGMLYVLCCDNNYKGCVCQIDMKTETAYAPLVRDISRPYSISADNAGFYVGTSDYVNTGDVLVYSRDGKLLHKFDSAGINPHKVLRIA